MSISKRPRENAVLEMDISHHMDLKFTSLFPCLGVTYLATVHALYAKMDDVEELVLLSGDERRHGLSDGNVSIASFINIHFVVRYHKGLIVLDNNRVRTVSMNGYIDTLDFARSDGEQMLLNPACMVQDLFSPHTFYISDSTTHKLFMMSTSPFTEEWELKELCGSTIGARDGAFEVASFCIPQGLAMDKEGRLLVADGGGKSIRCVDIKSQTVTTLVRLDSSPHSMLCIEDKIILSLPDAGSICIFDGIEVQKLAPRLRIHPWGIMSDASGNLLFLDNGRINVMEMDQIGVERRFKTRSMHETARDVIASDFRGMFEAKKFCDLVLYVGGKRFETHKVVLASRSAFFSTLVHWEAQQGEARLTFEGLQDADSSHAFGLLLRYFYSATLPSGNELWQHGHLEALTLMCTLYTEDTLLSHCVQLYTGMLSTGNLMERLTLAEELHLDVLKEAVMAYIKIPTNATDFSMTSIATLKTLRPHAEIFDVFIDSLVQAQSRWEGRLPVFNEDVYRLYWFKTLKLLRADEEVFARVVEQWKETPAEDSDADYHLTLWMDTE